MRFLLPGGPTLVKSVGACQTPLVPIAQMDRANRSTCDDKAAETCGMGLALLSNPDFGGKLASKAYGLAFPNTDDQRGVPRARLNQHGGSGHQPDALHFTQRLRITV